MAVVKCKECGAQVSTKAKACPTCGAKPPKKTSVLVWILAALIAAVFLKIAFSGESVRAPTSVVEAPSAEKNKEIDAALAKGKADAKERDDKQKNALWAAKESVVKMLNDPDSAKFGKVVYRDPGIVCGYVNAKNGFGGYVGEKGFISFGTPNLTWMEGQSKDFEKIWNEKCASK